MYYTMVKYIKERFEGHIYMPLLVIDSADQCMTSESAKLLYQDIVERAAQSLDMLIVDFIELIQYARQITAKQVNLVQLMTYYSLGKWIVEEQQGGKERAKYGKQVLKKLSESLTKEFGRGFSETNLEYARKFYLTYAD